MEKKRKKFSPNEHLILFSQVNGLCPLCLKDLTYQKNGKINKKYEIAHIYPCNPTEIEKNLLKTEEILSLNVDDLDNVIPLCAECHTKFDKPRTVEEYRYLLEKKKELIKNQNVKQHYGVSNLSEEISDIIDELQKGEWDESPVKLTYKALKVENKLKFEFNYFLREQIIHNIISYYLLIQKLFSSMDKNNPGTFVLISSQIKVFYLQLNRENDDQEFIFNKMSEWIHLKCHNKGSLDACKVIISFFIQNCEVFEDVTK